MTTVEDEEPPWDDYDDGYRWDPTDEELDRLLREHGQLEPEPTDPDDLEPDPELDAFLHEPDPDYEWLIPQVLERGDRVILTGAEGAGKSTLLRQIGVQCASGIHPFTGAPMDPVNVLLVDLENSRRQTKRQLRPLRLAAGAEYPNRYLNILVRTAGLDLTDAFDRVWLEDRIRANQPDVVIIGPIYKMHEGDPTEEGPARQVVACLDYLRVTYGFALLIEAHSPHASGGGTRPTRPYGASLWMRWPEFGLHITEQGHLKHWRGDRDERDWPASLIRGGDWPWTPATGSEAKTWAAVVRCVVEHGGPMSYSELAEKLNVSKAWVGRVCKNNEVDWAKLKEEIGGVWP